jgi:hypothetical protein
LGISGGRSGSQRESTCGTDDKASSRDRSFIMEQPGYLKGVQISYE